MESVPLEDSPADPEAEAEAEVEAEAEAGEGEQEPLVSQAPAEEKDLLEEQNASKA